MEINFVSPAPERPFSPGGIAAGASGSSTFLSLLMQLLGITGEGTDAANAAGGDLNTGTETGGNQGPDAGSFQEPFTGLISLLPSHDSIFDEPPTPVLNNSGKVAGENTGKHGTRMSGDWTALLAAVPGLDAAELLHYLLRNGINGAARAAGHGEFGFPFTPAGQTGPEAGPMVLNRLRTLILQHLQENGAGGIQGAGTAFPQGNTAAGESGALPGVLPPGSEDMLKSSTPETSHIRPHATAVGIPHTRAVEAGRPETLLFRLQQEWTGVSPGVAGPESGGYKNPGPGEEFAGTVARESPLEKSPPLHALGSRGVTGDPVPVEAAEKSSGPVNVAVPGKARILEIPPNMLTRETTQNMTSFAMIRSNAGRDIPPGNNAVQYLLDNPGGGEITGASSDPSAPIIHRESVNLLQMPGLISRVLQQAVARQIEGQTHLWFKLEPEHLGEVMIRLIYRHGDVSAHFLASNPAAGDAIESALPQLREALAAQNLHLHSASVSVGHEGGLPPRSDYQQPGYHYGRQHSGSGERPGGSTGQEPPAHPLPGGINLFV
ncbi:flagellar hook-length control protein [Desulfofundulus kuznetsovii DSM 6115]|uniref:Flagellar hook-length control protein n=1 Tax=Desulfofundulus kuznetsovii (strain DSM 6115 / VKM B-1805 / 17) TaxID=760568 RepID=A0AAU8PBI1_DESK7|nr:flagellar hook-length control protein [Desulfofundulus kuznetsovii DSM 6115]